MTFRITEDFISVTDHEKVYEILWQWMNAEHSEAYVRETSVDRVPKGVNMWKSKFRCEKECYKRNQLNKIHFYEVI